MNVHKNARTIRYSRAEMVRRVIEQRETSKAVATAFGVSRRTVAKWLARCRLGVRPCLYRRRLSRRLQPNPPRREKGKRRRLPPRRHRILSEPGYHRRPRDDRQRLMLSQPRLP